MDSILESQRDMRAAYRLGAPGVICSGLVWLAAGIVAAASAPMHGILTLVFGGIIFPSSVLLCKLLGSSGKHHKSNALSPLALEGTVWMLACIPLAVVLAIFDAKLFFPAMLLVIAGRYLSFRTLYGLRSYYMISALLAASALLIGILKPPSYLGGLAGGLVEIGFGMWLLHRNDRAKKTTTT